MIKTNIKLRVTPKQSECVQKICFANNIGWGDELELNFLDAPCLFIDHRWLSYSHDIKFYNGQDEEEIDPDLFIRTNGTCEETVCETISTECQFTKYGFEKPDFECELWQVETSTSFEYVHGLVLNDYAHPMGNLEYHKWNKKTGEVLVGCSSKSLTPIKKPWYETCKFPALLIKLDGLSHETYGLASHCNHANELCVNNAYEHVDDWRLLTDEEIETCKQGRLK